MGFGVCPPQGIGIKAVVYEFLVLKISDPLLYCKGMIIPIEKLLIERTRRATLCPYQVEIRPINIAIIKEFLPKCRFISINAFLQECRVPSSSARVYFKVRSNGCAVK